VGRVDVIQTNESRGITNFMGTLHNIQKYCVVPLRKENRVATRLLHQLVKTNTEVLNLNPLGDVNYSVNF